jgi:hypothetical protein
MTALPSLAGKSETRRAQSTQRGMNLQHCALFSFVSVVSFVFKGVAFPLKTVEPK